LLRSLTRAGKAQQKMLARMLKASKPRKPPKPPRPSKPKESAAATPGKWVAASFPSLLQQGGGHAQRIAYWLYLPENVPDAVSLHGWPLLVMLHGCRQSATQFAQGTRMNALAEKKGYAVLYPQQSIGAQAQRCWRWYSQSAQSGGSETALLIGLIRSICEQYPIDRRRIYACGISAGAGMAAALALNHPELIAAVGLHSGPVFGAAHNAVDALHVMRHGAALQGDEAIRVLLARRAIETAPGQAGPIPPLPALLIQGEDDQIVYPINQHQLARQWLQLNGLPAGAPARVTIKHAGRGQRRRPYEIHDYLVGRKVLLRVARIAGIGHAWSGGDPELKFHAQEGPDASRMMLEFFGKHRR
jgi:poly(hydroxyalkanoate) depolymerase family esterase